MISYTQSYQIDCLEFISLCMNSLFFVLFFVVLKDYSFDIKSNHLSIIYSYITKLLLDAVCCMIFIDHLGWFEDKLST